MTGDERMKFVVENCRWLEGIYGREAAIEHFLRQASGSLECHELDKRVCIAQGGHDEHVKGRIGAAVAAVEVNVDDGGASTLGRWSGGEWTNFAGHDWLADRVFHLRPCFMSVHDDGDEDCEQARQDDSRSMWCCQM